MLTRIMVVMILRLCSHTNDCIISNLIYEDGKVASMFCRGQHELAAALAVFHLNVARASVSLSRCAGAVSPGYPHNLTSARAPYAAARFYT